MSRNSSTELVCTAPMQPLLSADQDYYQSLFGETIMDTHNCVSLSPKRESDPAGHCSLPNPLSWRCGMHSFRVCMNGLDSVCRQALLTEFVIVLIADFFLAQNASQIACFIPYRASTTGGELNNDSFVRRPPRPIAIFRAAE